MVQPRLRIFLKLSIRFDKCSCIVTDGSRAMIGTEIGFAGLLKQNNINCPVIHQETLYGKSLRQMNVIKVVVKITNMRQSCFDSQKISRFFGRGRRYIWGLHTDIRWLSAGNFLQRFYALRKEIPIFLKNEVKSDTTYHTHLNEFNLKQQGKEQNIANLYGHIRGY